MRSPHGRFPPALRLPAAPMRPGGDRMHERDELARLYGSRLCSSMSIATRHACEAGIT